MGPHPFPTMVRDFQAVISKEIKEQLLEKEGKLPDAVIACVGGGSNAIGAFYHFINDPSVRLIGCEAAGRGVDTAETAATIATGRPGIFHGMKSYFCQDQFGQIAPVYSISAGLDYPGIGPEHAHLHDIGRAEYRPGHRRRRPWMPLSISAAWRASFPPSNPPMPWPTPESWPLPWAGIRSSSSTFPAGVTRTARPSPATEGRIFMSNIAKAFANGKAFIPFVTCGDPDLETTAKVVRAMAQAGADLIELGIPFSDPTAEGPVIQEANVRALAAGTTTDKIFDLVRDLRRDVTIPMVFMTYANVVFSYGAEKFISTCADIGIDGLILPDIPYEEKDEFDPICKRYGVDLISMAAPTSENRIAMIAREATGFLYIVSSLGVTGVRSEITTDIGALVRLVREIHVHPLRRGLRHLHTGAGAEHGRAVRRGHRRQCHRQADRLLWPGRRPPCGGLCQRNERRGASCLIRRNSHEKNHCSAGCPDAGRIPDRLRRRTDRLRSSRGGNRCTGREFHSLCREERIRYDALSLLYHHQPNGGLPTG